MEKQKVINGVTVTLFNDVNEFLTQNEIESKETPDGFNIQTNYGAAVYGLFESKKIGIVKGNVGKMDMVIGQAVNKMFSENKEQIKSEILEFIN